jgi:CRP/FNR family transcriptional regulator
MQSEDLGRLAAVAGQRRLPARKTFLNEGDDATHFFNNTSGAVKVYKLLPNGRRQITGFLFAGDLLGFAFNDTYTYSAETLTEVHLCRFPRGQFEGLIEAFPKVEHRLLALISIPPKGFDADQTRMPSGNVRQPGFQDRPHQNR